MAIYLRFQIWQGHNSPSILSLPLLQISFLGPAHHTFYLPDQYLISPVFCFCQMRNRLLFSFLYDHPLSKNKNTFLTATQNLPLLCLYNLEVLGSGNTAQSSGSGPGSPAPICWVSVFSNFASCWLSCPFGFPRSSIANSKDLIGMLKPFFCAPDVLQQHMASAP